MTLQRKAATWTAFLVAALLCPTIFAQTSEAPQSPEAALAELRDAPTHERAEKRKALVALGQEAVAPTLAELNKGSQSEDMNLLANCVIALGELKADAATDSLVQLLHSSNLEVAYFAAEALGAIREGKGAADDTGKKVNAALLAFACSDVPPEATYGPALALVKINSINLARPENLPAPELTRKLVEWANANSNALPPAADQPWQLNLRTLLTSTDAATRQAALQALRQKRALEAVEPILGVLARNSAGAAKQDLSKLLGELTGVLFPPPGGTTDSAEQVAAWRVLWLDKLKKETGPSYTQLSLRELERNLRNYDRAPDENGADMVRAYRSVLIHQLSQPEDIPPGTSPKARDLLTPALESKQKIAAAMQVLEGSPADYDKTIQLNVIQDEARETQGKEAGLQFLSRIAQLGRAEVNETVAIQIGTALGLISGIPCNLDADSLDARRKQLDEWISIVRMQGIAIEP